eukprot:264828-Rhodomonas_salina.2
MLTANSLAGSQDVDPAVKGEVEALAGANRQLEAAKTAAESELQTLQKSSQALGERISSLLQLLVCVPVCLRNCAWQQRLTWRLVRPGAARGGRQGCEAGEYLDKGEGAARAAGESQGAVGDAGAIPRATPGGLCSRAVRAGSAC